MAYRKFVYWLSSENFLTLKEELKADGFPQNYPQKAVCMPLLPDVKIGYILPETWKKFPLCRRQLSWYGVSRLAGLVLVVTSFNLDKYDAYLSAVIRKSDFTSDKCPGREEQLRLISQKSYQQKKPNRWEDIASEYPGKLDKWLKLMGVAHISFKELFITHCANHANFIDPVYFVSDETGPIPYSIDKTKFVCSACLEFYNIIGQNHHKKLVLPCPGAVKFAGLPEDQYFEVTSFE